jgi:uncharacterized protein
MGDDGYGEVIALIERLHSEMLELRPEGTRVVDVHTHLGVDTDGRSLTPEAHIAQMDATGVAYSVVFALNEADQEPAYRAPNDRVLAWAEAGGGRFVPFARLLLDESPVAEAERCVDRGARGIKLHPRAQVFRVDDPRLEAVFAFAAERRLPVLIHAGRGLPAGMVQELGRVADRHPEASLILAHAAIAEQGRIGEWANGHPNIFFDTSTWTPLDLLALFSLVGPEQVLYASDAPYGSSLAAQLLTLRTMRRIGLDDATMAAIMGGTADALLQGRRPAHISPPAGAASVQASFPGARVHTYLAAAAPFLWYGHPDGVGLIGLAESACHDGNGRLDGIAELVHGAGIAWRSSLLQQDPLELLRRRRAAFELMNSAQAGALFAS